MDLTIPLENKILNIRSLVIVKNENGYIFEKHRNGYCFGVGGRVKIGESSKTAAIREIKEELNVDIDIDNIKFVTVIENFFENIHEISFVYEYNHLIETEVSVGFEFVKEEKIKDLDIRPEILKEIILNKERVSKSYIVES